MVVLVRFMLRNSHKNSGSRSLLSNYSSTLGAQIDRRRSELALVASSKEAETASRAKSEFLANMSHELRTPLNAILGFSEIIHKGRFGSDAQSWERYQSYAGDIHEASTHLLHVVNDILDMSRIESGRLELDFQEVSATDLFAGVQNMLAERAEQAKLTLSIDIEDGLHNLEADERRLKQTLINLAGNAIKFTEAGGKVTLGARKAGLGIALFVADTGVGMTPGQLATAMEPFRQVDGTLARQQEGTGLGLPLAKAFAELHDATFSISSTPGTGTTALIRFPIHRIRKTEPAPLSAAVD